MAVGSMVLPTALARLRRKIPLLPWAWAFLLGLTLVAALPWSPEGPLDARNFAPLSQFRLTYPFWAGWLEPLLAPGHALMGAPDFRLALPVTLAWGAGLSAMFSLRGFFTRQGAVTRNRPGKALETGRAALAALGAVSLGVLYFLTISSLHLPGWRLTPLEPDVLLADFHSHSTVSHDGLDSALTNLRWHAQRGYTLSAMTDHDLAEGGFAARALVERQVETQEAQRGETLPAVLPGVEVWERRVGAFLLGLGLREGEPLPWVDGLPQPETGEAIQAIQKRHGGAVIALYWKIGPGQVRRLAELGVDGFEILNLGHLGQTPELRAELLSIAIRKGLALVTSTDWHGWSGYTRGWTAVRVPGAAGMTRRQQAQAVTRLLAERKAEAFTPVAAGYIGPPSTLRLIFAPFAETVRYAGELDPARVAAWWVWAIGAGLLAGTLKNRGFRPVRWGLCLLVGAMGTALLWRGGYLAGYFAGGAANPFAAKIANYTLVCGAVALAVALALTFTEWRRLGSSPERQEGA